MTPREIAEKSKSGKDAGEILLKLLSLTNNLVNV